MLMKPTFVSAVIGATSGASSFFAGRWWFCN